MLFQSSHVLRLWTLWNTHAQSRKRLFCLETICFKCYCSQWTIFIYIHQDLNSWISRFKKKKDKTILSMKFKKGIQAVLLTTIHSVVYLDRRKQYTKELKEKCVTFDKVKRRKCNLPRLPISLTQFNEAC